MAVSFAGPVGLVYMAASGIIGYDPIAGVSLTPEERIATLSIVVTSPPGEGRFLVRDPWAGGSTYEVGSGRIKQYVAGGTFR
jgi:hypothetical protein